MVKMEATKEAIQRKPGRSDAKQAVVSRTVLTETGSGGRLGIGLNTEPPRRRSRRPLAAYLAVERWSSVGGVVRPRSTESRP